MHRGGGVLLTGLKQGNATLSISIDDTDSDMLPPESVNASISVLPKTSLPPSKIQEITRAGQHTNMFAVGDLFPIELNGMVTTVDVSGVWYVTILGFDHNKATESNNTTHTIHFQFPYNEASKGLVFVEAVGVHGYLNSVPGFRMNLSKTTSGGWTGSYMYKDVITLIHKIFPSSWRDILSGSICKFRDNAGTVGTQLEIGSSSSSFWLLAEFEVFGVRKYANSYEQIYQKQYDLYKSGTSKIRYSHISFSTSVPWWLSSHQQGTSDSFSYVDSNGNVSALYANCSLGISPCFAVA